MIISFSTVLAIGKMGFSVACSPCLRNRFRRRDELSGDPKVLAVLASPTYVLLGPAWENSRTFTTTSQNDRVGLKEKPGLTTTNITGFLE